MFTRKELEDAVTLLNNLKENGPHADFFGICYNITYNGDEHVCPGYRNVCPGYRIVEVFSLGWEKHTGIEFYPVPDEVGVERWKNPARWELVDYLIERITAELQSMSV